MRRLLIQTLWTVVNCSEPHFQRNTEALRNRWILPVSVCFLLPACVFRNVESAMVLRLVTYEEPREWILCWTSSPKTRKSFLGRSVTAEYQRLDYSQAPLFHLTSGRSHLLWASFKVFRLFSKSGTYCLRCKVYAASCTRWTGRFSRLKRQFAAASASERSAHGSRVQF